MKCFEIEFHEFHNILRFWSHDLIIPCFKVSAKRLAKYEMNGSCRIAVELIKYFIATSEKLMTETVIIYCLLFVSILVVK